MGHGFVDVGDSHIAQPLWRGIGVRADVDDARDQHSARSSEDIRTISTCGLLEAPAKQLFVKALCCAHIPGQQVPPHEAARLRRIGRQPMAVLVVTVNTAARTNAALIDMAGNNRRGTLFGAGMEATSTREAMEVPYSRLLLSKVVATSGVSITKSRDRLTGGSPLEHGSNRPVQRDQLPADTDQCFSLRRIMERAALISSGLLPCLTRPSLK